MRVTRLVVLAALAMVAVAGCTGSRPGPVGAALASSAPSQSAIPLSQVCGGDAVVTTLTTRYDGTQPYCRGYPGDGAHIGEGRAAIGDAEGTATAVEMFILTNARAIFTFQPTKAWLAGHPYGRDVEGFFIRQTNPQPGGSTARAYKDFLTPPPGDPGNEKQTALVAVIISPTVRLDPVHNASYGGVWLVGCLDRPTANRHELFDPCPAWVWSGYAVLSTTKRL